jgi:hypothetical protein
MAEKPKVNKSQAVRDYLKANPGVGNTEVAASLTKSGVKVSPNLVATIKANMKDRRLAKKAAKAVKPTSPAAAAQDKPRTNKTQAVRDFLKANPGVRNIEVAESLGKSGIKVTANYVATIKGKMKIRRKKVKRAVRSVVASRGVGVPEIKAAFGLLKLAGGIKEATAALDAAQEIKGMI